MLPPIFDPSPGFPEARAVIAELKAALVKAAPPKVVVLSTIGAAAPVRLSTPVTAFDHGADRLRLSTPAGSLTVRAVIDRRLEAPVLLRPEDFWS